MSADGTFLKIRNPRAGSGATLYFEARPGVPPTIFLHGFGGDLSGWDSVWRDLPPERGYLRYDLRGFGRSQAPGAEPFSHSDDLLGLLDAIGEVRCDLVGVSMGGSIALNFALSHPDRVSSLCLLSPGLIGWEWSDAWRSFWAPIITAARAGEMDDARRLWFAHPLFSTTRGRACAEQLRAEVSRFPGDQWIEDFQLPARPDLERLHTLQPPTLLLSGARDLPDFRLIADVISAAAPNASRHDAPDLGHMLHLEDPEWCREQLVAFWRAEGDRTGRF